MFGWLDKYINLSLLKKKNQRKNHQMKAPITVKDLVDKLSSLPPDAIVLAYSWDFEPHLFTVPEYFPKTITIDVTTQEGCLLPAELHGKLAVRF